LYLICLRFKTYRSPAHFVYITKPLISKCIERLKTCDQNVPSINHLCELYLFSTRGTATAGVFFIPSIISGALSPYILHIKKLQSTQQTITLFYYYCCLVSRTILQICKKRYNRQYLKHQLSPPDIEMLKLFGQRVHNRIGPCVLIAITQRILHGRAEIRILSSSVEKISNEWTQCAWSYLYGWDSAFISLYPTVFYIIKSHI